ncbi:uncharacterized protein LOC136089330 [Hydra vulgaris]|uniref:Uncharacterized protein LOC136089330 n=1 Tax=Hydra vulgaris TaxID=6087 RepID=A0ABM4DAI0_HYDVU
MDWVKGGPDGAVYTTSSKGWMECPHFLEWFQSIFLMYTKHLANRPRVLIFDGHISHISSPLIDLAKKNNVILLRIPAHLTHLLQPLDTSVFRPVKSKWQSLLIKYARTHNGPVSKKHFPGLLRTLFQSSFTMEQVKSGFKGTGIFPLNKDAIDTRLFNQCFQSPVKKPTFSTNHLTRSCSMSNLQSICVNDAPISTSISSPSSLPVSTSTSSIKDFFLKQLQSKCAETSLHGRSARVKRFRYGESLTSEACLKRTREASKKQNKKKLNKKKIIIKMIMMTTAILYVLNVVAVEIKVISGCAAMFVTFGIM